MILRLRSRTHLQSLMPQSLSDLPDPRYTVEAFASVADLRSVGSGQPEQQPEAVCMAPGSTHKQRRHAISIARRDIRACLHTRRCGGSQSCLRTRLP